MPIELLQTVDIIELMENYMDKMRPPEEMRNKVDFGYRIDDQSVILFELRPTMRAGGKLSEIEFAKATLVKKTGKWKVYWRRANLTWHPYGPNLEVNSLREFLAVVDEDASSCFYG